MRRVCICALTAAAFIGKVWAGPDSDAVRQFGLVGVWRLDCSKPASNSNPELVHAAPEQGLPTTTSFNYDFPSKFTSEMRAVRIIAPDRLAFTTSSSAVVLLMRDGRLRTFDSINTKTGEVWIKDGFYTLPAGAPTLLFERCEAKLSALPDTQVLPAVARQVR